MQASGVSRLLLKGQQYSAPPNMQRIHVLDKWRFPEHMQCYLDATMFLLAKDGRIIDTVDFSHTHSQGTRMTGAVSHSGDMMEATHGTHTIDVQLAQLGKLSDSPASEFFHPVGMDGCLHVCMESWLFWQEGAVCCRTCQDTPFSGAREVHDCCRCAKVNQIRTRLAERRQVQRQGWTW